MRSAIDVHGLQTAILDPNQSLILLLRRAKLIAAKLNLEDAEQWFILELQGYPPNSAIPQYRTVAMQQLEYHQPVNGWQPLKEVIDVKLHIDSAIEDIVRFSENERIPFPIPLDQKIVLNTMFGLVDWPQRLTASNKEFKRVLECVRNRLLEWTLELKKRGITGKDENFDEQEIQSATAVKIEQLVGVFGKCTNSQSGVDSYNPIRQLLIDQKFAREERWKLEEIFEELKTAPPEKTKGVILKAESWLVTHWEMLGATAELVGKFIDGL